MAKIKKRIEYFEDVEFFEPKHDCSFWLKEFPMWLFFDSTWFAMYLSEKRRENNGKD